VNKQRSFSINSKNTSPLPIRAKNQEGIAESPIIKNFIDSANAEFEQNQKVWMILQVIEFMGRQKNSSPERIDTD
jgi:hypothetical protein